MTTSAAPPAGTVLARIRAAAGTLHPSEQRVAKVFLDRPEWTIEASAQDVADAAATSRATVVRTAQRLGFAGYPQLRVLLARDVGLASGVRDASRAEAPVAAHEVVRAYFHDVAHAVDGMLALLDPGDVAAAVDLLLTARTTLVVGNGLSATLASEAAMRLNSIGRAAEAPADYVNQAVKARLLGPEDVCLAVSGTGSTTPTLQAARAARAAGAPIVALTAFTASPLADLASVTLVASMGPTSFRDEVTTTTRIPQVILVNALVRAVAERDPAGAHAARTRLLEVIGEAFVQDPL